MKKIFFYCITLFSTAIYGASIDALANPTTAYLGNPSQNATTNSEAAYYNPAGLVYLEDGNYISGGIQVASTTYMMKANKKEYEGTDPNGLIPNLSYIHKNGDWALYGTMGAAGGGAALTYDDGIPSIDALLNTPSIPTPTGDLVALGGENIVEGSRAYLMFNLGTAYRINSKWSMSGAARLISAKRTFEMEVRDTLDLGTGGLFDGYYDATEEATGIGGVFGINYKLNDKLNMGLTYTTKIKLKFETSAKGTDTNLGGVIATMNQSPDSPLSAIADGKKRWRDLPAELKYGVAYKVNNDWTVMGGGSYYFLSGADIDGNDGYDDGWEINIGTEYQVSPRWTLTTGYNYSSTGAGDSTFSDSELSLDSHIFSAGAKFQQTPNLLWTFAVMNVQYITDDVYNSSLMQKVEYNKNIISGGISATYKF